MTCDIKPRELTDRELGSIAGGYIVVTGAGDGPGCAQVYGGISQKALAVILQSGHPKPDQTILLNNGMQDNTCLKDSITPTVKSLVPNQSTLRRMI